MKVEYVRRTGPFVQVIDILGDDLHVEIALQSGDSQVCGIGFGGEHLAPPVVVETDHAPTVEIQSLGNTNLLDLVIPPRPVGIAERRKTAFGADSGAGKDYEFFHGME